MELLHPGDGGLVVLGLFTYTGDFLMYTCTFCRKCKVAGISAPMCKPALRKKNFIIYVFMAHGTKFSNAPNKSSTTPTLQEKTELLDFIVNI